MDPQAITPTESTGNKGTDKDQILSGMRSFAAAVRTRDMNGILAVYADDVVVFDVRDALQINKEGLRKSWQECFDGSRDFSVDFLEPQLKIEGDLAFGFTLTHSTGTANDGQKVDIWLRITHGFERRNGKWMVVHEHVSAPGDFITGKILQDLKPDQIH